VRGAAPPNAAGARDTVRGTDHIYLVPGFFGFANLGELKYFGHVRQFLVQHSAAAGLNARVHVVKTHPTASLPTRAARLFDAIATTPRAGRGAIHLIGHSSGGLDCRLALAPDVRLPTSVDRQLYTNRVRSVVTVSTPHHGTPVASFFTGLLGQKLLQVLSLSTIYMLRFGRLPIAVLLQLGSVLTRLDNLGMNSALLDELFGKLLRDFSIGRRRAVQRLFHEVALDQGLLLQLTPEAMDLFNALTHSHPGVRYGSVTTRAQAPGVRSTLAAGLDPSAQATHAIYRTLYRLAAQTPRARWAQLSADQRRMLRRAYGTLPTMKANDGLVPTRSQVWGDVIHAAQADHLDVIGHFGDPSSAPPHFDWLTTGSGFGKEKFEAVWEAVLRFLAAR
jgi:triacylglycerol lipase